MKKMTKYSINKESIEDMNRAKRFNPCLEITFQDQTGKHTHKINAGYKDQIHLYQEQEVAYVLSRNMSLGYIGIEAFTGDQKQGEIFLEAHQVDEMFAQKKSSPLTIIRRLKQHIIT
jgi:hypothetical protein